MPKRLYSLGVRGQESGLFPKPFSCPFKHFQSQSKAQLSSKLHLSVSWAPEMESQADLNPGALPPTPEPKSVGTCDSDGGLCCPGSEHPIDLGQG